MAKILNIDTSGSICSVSLSEDGEIIMGLESPSKMDHSRTLAPFIKKILDFLRERQQELDAVCVSFGPGSYTGLRIGLSMAKGLAFGLNIPMITISSLEIMAVRAIFSYPDFMGDELIIPMIDARRMEVYSAIYDSSLKLKEEEMAHILTSESFIGLKDKSKVLFIGDGTEKFKSLYTLKNAVWLGNGMSHAKYMGALAEKYFREKKFSDIAYSVPNYLKEYQTTIPKTKI